MKRKILMFVTVASLAGFLRVPTHLSAQQTNHLRRHNRYKLVDLTLGGPSSLGIPGQPINNQGTVVGTSCLDSQCAVTHAFRWKRGVLTDLGALPDENLNLSLPGLMTAALSLASRRMA